MNVFFDVQGTLISGGRARPHVREAFTELGRMGHHVYLWSSAGSGYAASAAKSLGVEDLVFGCYSKSGHVPVTVDFAVDDQPGFAAGNGGYTIPAYKGGTDDEELWRVIEAVRR